MDFVADIFTDVSRTHITHARSKSERAIGPDAEETVTCSTLDDFMRAKPEIGRAYAAAQEL